MTQENYSPEFLNLLKSVIAKRPKTVINHILQHGQITTEELKDIYGYNHPPRAIRDVREQGIPNFRLTTEFLLKLLVNAKNFQAMLMNICFSVRQRIERNHGAVNIVSIGKKKI